MMTEQGPLRPQPDGTLAKNQYSWNTVANMLYIEQPMGVGFSYSPTRSDYHMVGDNEAAENDYRLILEFLNRFPEVILIHTHAQTNAHAHMQTQTSIHTHAPRFSTQRTSSTLPLKATGALHADTCEVHR